MATYCDTTAMQIILTNVDFDTSTSLLVDKCMTNAEQEINKYIGKRFDLSSSYFTTSTSVPPLLRSMCEDLAEAYFYEKGIRASKEGLAKSRQIIKRVTDNLVMIKDREADLFDTAGSLILDKADSNYVLSCNTTNYTGTFDLDTSTSWGTDTDRLEDIADSRD